MTVGQILGSSTLGTNYIKDIDYYLARGHLAARADFVYSTHQRATFWYINTAPQWQTFNSGNWKVLEDNLREYGNIINTSLVQFRRFLAVLISPVFLDIFGSILDCL